MEEPQFNFWVRKIHWRRNRLPTPVFLGFPCDSAGKESACNVGDLGSIPGLGRSPGEGKGYSLQYSNLENSMDCIGYGVANSRTWLSEFHFHFPQAKASQSKNRQMELHKIKGLFIVKETINNNKKGILLKSLFANDILKKGLIT